MCLASPFIGISFSNLHSQQQCMSSPQFTTFWLTLGITNLFSFSHSGWCEVLSHWVLICIYLLDEAEKLFMYLMAIWIFSLVACLYGHSWCSAQNPRILITVSLHLSLRFWTQLLLIVVPETDSLQRPILGLLEFAYSVC